MLKKIENEKIHLGVYGLYISERKMFMVKKVRGPYTGRYDLPGGKIEFNEKINDCLKREIMEETGAEVQSSKFFSVNECLCEYEKNRETKKSHHVGIYYIVDLKIKKLKTEADGEDSGGAIFIPIDVLNKDNTSPIAYEVITKFLESSYHFSQ
ncbi:MAG: NUDIX domain-containing protein [Patescibacteria group bacterium]